MLYDRVPRVQNNRKKSDETNGLKDTNPEGC